MDVKERRNVKKVLILYSFLMNLSWRLSLSGFLLMSKDRNVFSILNMAILFAQSLFQLITNSEKYREGRMKRTRY